MSLFTWRKVVPCRRITVTSTLYFASLPLEAALLFCWWKLPFFNLRLTLSEHRHFYLLFWGFLPLDDVVSMNCQVVSVWSLKVVKNGVRSRSTHHCKILHQYYSTSIFGLLNVVIAEFSGLLWLSTVHQGCFLKTSISDPLTVSKVIGAGIRLWTQKRAVKSKQKSKESSV